MKKLTRIIAVSLMAMLMSVSAVCGVNASAATKWNTGNPKLDISVQSNAENRTFAIKVYYKNDAVKYKVQERGQDPKTGKFTSWKTIKTYNKVGDGNHNYKRFTVAKNASDTNIYHYRVIAYNASGAEIITEKRLTTATPYNVKVTASTDSKTGEAYNLVRWNGLMPTGFQLWRATSKNGTYHAVGGCIRGNFYYDTDVKEGVTYYYKLRSYKKLASARYYSDFSSIVSVKSAMNKIATPQVTSFTYDQSSGFTVKYKSRATKVDGYEIKIFDSNKKQVLYKQTDSKTTSVTLNSSDIKDNTGYYLEIKAFINVNGTKSYSNKETGTVKVPKKSLIYVGKRPQIKDVTYNADCTYTDGKGDDGNGNRYVIFVGYNREFELTDGYGEVLSTNNTDVIVTENGVDKTDELVYVTSSSKGISIEPRKATSGKVTITFKRTDGVASKSYDYQFINIADMPSTLNKYCFTRDYDGKYPTTIDVENERDSSRYALSQIANNYSVWLTNNGKEDSLFNKLLYSYEVTIRVASYCDYVKGDPYVPYSSDYYGALINHKSDCDGNAVTFDAIAKMIGYPSNYLTYNGYNNMYGVHSFNWVTLDGNKWYEIDCDGDRYTKSYGSFMRGYYGFACSSQEEYDSVVSKAKSEFKTAIEQISKKKGLKLKVVDSMPSDYHFSDLFYIDVSTGNEYRLKTSITEWLTNYIDRYLAENQIRVGDSIYVCENNYGGDGSTWYTEPGVIQMRFYTSSNSTSSINSASLYDETENSEAEPTVTAEPTVEPTATPTPTVEPTVEPTIEPTIEPTAEPTEVPEDSESSETAEESVSEESTESTEETEKAESVPLEETSEVSELE